MIGEHNLLGGHSFLMREARGDGGDGVGGSAPPVCPAGPPQEVS